MRIDWIEVKNFKSLRETPRIQLGERMTLIVGKNNSGKSALLEAMSLRPSDSPHRSSKTIPRSGNRPAPQCIDYGLVGSGQDVRMCLDGETRKFTLPAAQGQVTQQYWQGVMAKVLDAPEIRISQQSGIWTGRYMGVLNRDGGTSVIFSADGPNGCRWVENQSDQAAGTDLEVFYCSHFQAQNVFRFHGERRVAARAPIQGLARLSGDASNLPDVLHTLLTKHRPKFQQVVSLVKRIIPEIHDLSATVEPPSCVAGIWQEDATDRADLVFLLDQCGTGVGQVVAMCCALVTADDPMVFLIDEPSSFLHPRATYELLELIRERPQHQYVISTHAPEVIAAVEPDRVYRLELKDGVTAIEEIDHNNLEDQRRVLLDVGAKLSSVFGADRVLWVEGRTEEDIFRKLLRQFFPVLLRGVKVLEVADTGVFDSKHAKRAHSVYERLTRGAGLLPPAVAILLDREKRKPDEVHRLAQDCPLLKFTKRKMVENYLLDADAVAAILTQDLVEAAALDPCGAAPNAVSPQAVDSWLAEHSGRREFECQAGRAQDAAAWNETVHAGKVLEALFQELSDQRTWFQKPSTSVRLAEWLLANKPAALAGLAEELRLLLETGALHTGTGTNGTRT